MPAVWGMIVVLVLLMSPEAQALGDEPRAGETLTQYLTPAILRQSFRSRPRRRGERHAAGQCGL